MRNIDDGEKKKEKIMVEIVATNVVASRSPERRPTATPTARAKSNEDLKMKTSQKLKMKGLSSFTFIAVLPMKIVNTPT